MSFLIPERTGMDQTILRSAINEVLPDLSDIDKDIVEEHLQSLGVETRDDFQFLGEADLLSALRPVQARKLLSAWKLRCKSSFAVQNASRVKSPLHEIEARF